MCKYILAVVLFFYQIIACEGVRFCVLFQMLGREEVKVLFLTNNSCIRLPEIIVNNVFKGILMQI